MFRRLVTQKRTFVWNGRSRFRTQAVCVQLGMTNSCFACMKLPNESVTERRLLLIEKGTIRLVILQILTLMHIN